MNGALMNVDQAVKRGMNSECIVCQKRGATAGCFKTRCINTYHVACAQQAGVTFFQDKVRRLNNKSIKKLLFFFPSKT